MAQGLQFKENLTVISGGYQGEGIGSNGVVQNWTDTVGESGGTTTTYFYHDSAMASDANSTKVEVSITDTWSAQLLPGNVYRITVTTVVNSINRIKVGNPSPYSASIRIKKTQGGSNVWTSGGCDNAATTHTIATNINVGTFSFDLPPATTGSSRGTIYYRSNICGHDSDRPPSKYVDEFWMGINFRNLLPNDYIPGKVLSGSTWLSHNRATNGHAKIYHNSSWGNDMRTIDGGTGTSNPPYIRHPSGNKNMRKVGQE